MEMFTSIKEASLKVNTPDSNIVMALKSKQRSAAGFRWEYVKESDANGNHIK